MRHHPTKVYTEREVWFARVPDVIRTLQARWGLTLEAPFDRDAVSSAWVAPALARGRRAVLKIAMPHMEGEHEIAGLRFWNGDGIVRLLDADDELGAMLLERCEPGTPLRAVSDHEQDEVIARLLRRLWRAPDAPHPFRPLSFMVAEWTTETRGQTASWPDEGLVREGLRAFADLSAPAPADVLLATDLHAGNVLRAEREAWLAIDPKPFVGDPAYDATQHLLNCEERLRAEPLDTIHRVADLLGVDRARVRLWLFARLAAEPRDDWGGDWRVEAARALAR